MTLRFAITARNHADVLARVVLLFHRSAVEIEAIRMPARGNKSDLTISITVDGRPPNAPRMPAILEKIVDVLSVETTASKRSSKRKQKEGVRGGTIG